MLPASPAHLTMYSPTTALASNSTGFEWARAFWSVLEQRELLSRLLPPEGRVLDVGGGPGVYAEWLSQRGYQVHLVDSVPLHVEEARRRAGQPPSFSVTQGDARALAFDAGSFDVVLLLGPLYHLAERDERVPTLGEARRVCRSGGTVIAAAISRFTPALDGVRRGSITNDQVFSNVQTEVAHGQRVAPEARISAFPEAYFHLPDELAAEASEAGLVVLDVYGIEGPAWLLADIEARMAEPVMRERIMWLARISERDPHLRAASAHLLLASTAP
jgi:ubiquinone/menaquinone biosynthesis C-methylase UbiE